MTTLIHVRNSEGTVGRCDAKCYEAKGPVCDCICHGMNHGAGLERAIERTSNLTAEMIKGIEARGGYVAPELLQRALL